MTFLGTSCDTSRTSLEFCPIHDFRAISMRQLRPFGPTTRQHCPWRRTMRGTCRNIALRRNLGQPVETYFFCCMHVQQDGRRRVIWRVFFEGLASLVAFPSHIILDYSAIGQWHTYADSENTHTHTTFGLICLGRGADQHIKIPESSFSWKLLSSTFRAREFGRKPCPNPINAGECRLNSCRL